MCEESSTDFTQIEDDQKTMFHKVWSQKRATAKSGTEFFLFALYKNKQIDLYLCS